MQRQVTGAFFDGQGKIALRQFEIPGPGPGQVQIDVKASGVCGSDLHQLMGRWSQPDFVLGHEIAGVVREVGPGVDEFSPGDRVCVEPFIFCGDCAYCRTGRYFMCREMGFLTLTEHGGFAEELNAPAYAVYRLPDTVSLELGALVEPAAVAVHATRLAQISPADSVLVLGAGTIGLMAVAAAKHFGARTVYVTSRHPHQSAAALALGADGVLPTDTDTLRKVTPKHFSSGPDVVLEAVGSEAGTFQQAIDLAGKLGRVALMGGNTGEMDGVNLAPVINKELVIYGSGCYSQIGTTRDFEVALDMLAARPEAFQSLITHRFPLAQIQQACDTALDKAASKAIKVMVVD